MRFKLLDDFPGFAPARRAGVFSSRSCQRRCPSPGHRASVRPGRGGNTRSALVRSPAATKTTARAGRGTQTLINVDTEPARAPSCSGAGRCLSNQLGVPKRCRSHRTAGSAGPARSRSWRRGRPPRLRLDRSPPAPCRPARALRSGSSPVTGSALVADGEPTANAGVAPTARQRRDSSGATVVGTRSVTATTSDMGWRRGPQPEGTPCPHHLPCRQAARQLR